MSFVHLHVHSHYSPLDGLGKPVDIVRKAKGQGSPAIALTDHGNLYGAIEFYKAAKKEGIKPIIGCEIYIAPRTRFDKTPGVDIKPYHMTLLAETNEGYQNLLKLVTQANLEGFYYKPRVDEGLLKAHHKGLIALSGCLMGIVPRAVLTEGTDKAAERALELQEIFGKDNFFLEVQDHGDLIEEQRTVNNAIFEIGKKHNIPVVATNDTHYINPEDAEAHDILLCIQTGTNVTDEGRMRYLGDFSLKSASEIQESFKGHPEVLENAVKVADRCNVELEFGQNLLPAYHTPNSIDPGDYLRELCEEGLENRYKNEKLKEAKERLDFELEMVHKMGFDTYFLIVHDFVKFAKDSKITVGPGRGSAAGSIIAYSLRITEVDPLEYGLIFERFLNPSRVSMPDIDIDFADDRRDEVLNYVIEKYGRENVAQIITFGTMAAKAVVRDVGRALGHSYGDVDRIAKLVPQPVLGKHAPLFESVKNNPELRQAYENEPKTKVLLDNAIKLEGTVRHAGTHACAVVISEEPLVNYAPLQRAPGSENDVVTQYSMKPIEDIGLLKMDFLGLRNLTIIEKTIKIVKRTQGEDVDLENIKMDDKKTFELLQKGDTTGVFQLESAGMRRYLKDLKPTQFEDIIAMVSLYRPGPMEWIPSYIKGKHNPKSIKYIHKSLETILKETNGVAIYQEQILQIAREFAGFSLGEADILRKAVGKKIPELLALQRQKFAEGAKSQGHSLKFAEEMFDKVIEPFAGYGFNKAHATCYALIAYHTAYLKAHYPIEFMTSLLCADFGNTDKVVHEINECEEMGISVLPPSINESFSKFTVVDDKTIRFGLSAIKGIGEGPVKEILAIRDDKGAFGSLKDFAERVPSHLLNKKLMEALSRSGALDKLGERKHISESLEEITQYSKIHQDVSAKGQTDIFGIITDDSPDDDAHFQLKSVEPASFMERLKWEKEYLGMYVSNHPLRGLKKHFSKKVILAEKLTRKDIGKNIKMGGLITGLKKVLTRSGEYMMYGTCEDPTGRFEIIIFPRTYRQYGDLFQEDNVVIMEGKLDFRRGALQFTPNSAQAVSIESMIDRAKNTGTFDPNEKIARQFATIEGLKPKEGENVQEIEDFDIDNMEETQRIEPFIISVDLDTDKTILSELKSLLTENRGDREVEIHIQNKDRLQRIKVPFLVNVDEMLKDEIEKILKV
ncbi:MAG: DNA polymerase III subunit alpha [Patescibacteria group bacterium]|nr:DNA polymerase III subunit alpha [Patescibacteria group bacterium]